jgi:hypothetical protein
LTGKIGVKTALRTREKPRPATFRAGDFMRKNGSLVTNIVNLLCEPVIEICKEKSANFKKYSKKLEKTRNLLT